MSKNQEIKRGRFNLEEMNYIKNNIKELGPEAIAKELKRTESSIREFANREGIIYEEAKPVEIIKKKISKELRESPEWEALKSEFTESELNYFAHRYSKLMAQFNEDVFPTEETQIFQVIKFEILMHRNLKTSKKGASDIKRLELELSKIYSKYENGDMSDTERSRVLELENLLVSLRSAQQSKSNEFIKLQEKHSSLFKDLKATRDQRITKFENSKKDILSLIKNFTSNTWREAEGRQQALVSLAVEKERARLSEYIEYDDGGVDKPILSSETVEDSNES